MTGDPPGFANDVAIVTGAGSGIGNAVARRLSRDGARVGLIDIDEAAVQRAADELREAGGEVVAYVADARSAEAMRAAVETVAAHFGTVGIAVANAGAERLRPFVETTPEFWDEMLATNLRSQMATIQPCLEHMIRARRGRVVTIASEAGRAGTRLGAPYSAAKGGVIALTKAVAREVAEYGITANSVAPGLVDTPLLQSLHVEDPNALERLLQRVPMSRVASSDEIAAVVAFLASDDASYVTGQVLSVNGGMSMS